MKISLELDLHVLKMNANVLNGHLFDLILVE